MGGELTGLDWAALWAESAGWARRMGVGLREWVVIRGLGWVLASLLAERSGLWGSWVQRGAAGGCGCGGAKGCWVHRSR